MFALQLWNDYSGAFGHNVWHKNGLKQWPKNVHYPCHLHEAKRGRIMEVLTCRSCIGSEKCRRISVYRLCIKDIAIICHVHFARSLSALGRCTRGPRVRLRLHPHNDCSDMNSAINLNLFCCCRYGLAAFAIVRQMYKDKYIEQVGLID